MTKDELVKENKKLKSKIRELQKQVVSDEGKPADLTSVAYGITAVRDEKRNKYNLAMVKIMFDLEKNCAMIDKESVVTETVGPLSVKAKRAIVTALIEKNKEINL